MNNSTTSGIVTRFAIITVIMMMATVKSYAQKERVQAAFIYQLTQLIEWCPDGQNGNFVIGVLGDAPELFRELSTLNNRRVGSQPIEVVPVDGVADIAQPNILFVASSQFGNIDQIETQVSGFCTLIISDQSGSASRGAGITTEYDERDGRLRLDISRRYMRDKSLNVSNRLYNLATNIY